MKYEIEKVYFMNLKSYFLIAKSSLEKIDVF